MDISATEEEHAVMGGPAYLVVMGELEAPGHVALDIAKAERLLRIWLAEHGWEIKYGYSGLTRKMCNRSRRAWYGVRRQTKDRLSLSLVAQTCWLQAAVDAAVEELTDELRSKT